MLNPTLNDAERFAVFRLSLVEGLGPVRLGRLLKVFGSAQTVLQASRSQLQEVDGIGPTIANALQDSTLEQRARDLLEQMQRTAVRLLLAADADFPPLLREIPA